MAIVATYVSASSQGQRTHSARTNVFTSHNVMLSHILGLHLPLQSAFLSSSFSSSSRSLSLDFLLGTQYLECLALPEDPVAGSFQATDVAW